MSSVDPISVALIAVGLVYPVLITIVLKRRRLIEWSSRFLILYLVLIWLWTWARTFWQTGWLDLWLAALSPEIWDYGTLVLAFAFFGLSWSVLQPRRSWWAFGALGVIWLLGVIVLDLNPLNWSDTLAWRGRISVSRNALASGGLIVGWGLAMVSATLIAILTHRRTQQPLHRNRIGYWSLALNMNVIGGALFLSGYPVLSQGFYLLGAFSAVGVALTHSLPDIRHTARQAVSYLVVTLLSILIYTTAFLVEHRIWQATSYGPLWVALGGALILGLLFLPLLDAMRKLVTRLISGIGYNPTRTLREFGMSISNILDLEQLATVVVGLVSEAMEIKRGALLVVHDANEDEGETEPGTHFTLRCVGGMGRDLPSKVLPAASPIVEYLRHERRPLMQYDVDLLPRFQDVSDEERVWLAELDMDIYVPIYAKNSWIGLLALGAKTSGDRYFEQDLVLLSTLADQTAVALENARLFDNLRARNLEIERLYEELRVANRELARLDKAKSDFIEIASHELRTPLTQVHGYNDVIGEMLKEGSLTREGGLEMIAGVRRGVTRLEEIVKTMFDVSKIDTETLALNLLPSPVAPIIKRAVEAWEPALKERHQRLQIRDVEDLPPIVADSDRLEQAFSHLIQNAIKFTPDGGEIEIRGHLLGEERDPEDRAIEIVVIDSGIGIAADELDRIWEKFYRVGDVRLHSTGKSKFKGAGPGLGLTVVRGIVQAHGGRCWAESPGYDEERCLGSEFHVLLPLQTRRLEGLSVDLQSSIDAVMQRAAEIENEADMLESLRDFLSKS